MRAIGDVSRCSIVGDVKITNLEFVVGGVDEALRGVE
jgi:hypothetical protein